MAQENAIKELFTNIKEKISAFKVSKEELENVNEKIDELETVATQLGQDSLVSNLTAQKSFNERIIKDIIPAGLDTYIDLREMQEILNDKSEDQVLPLAMKTLSEFPRPIPAENTKAISKVKDLFDDIYIIFTDFTGEERKLDDEVQKEKDPIAFGIMNYSADNSSKIIYSTKMVFITDWIDEYCDLTLDKLLEEFDVNEYKLSETIEEGVQRGIVDGEPI